VIPFDALIFDLDGTLVATERFWPDAARAGARRAFTELGLERDLPTTAEWMDMVGRPIDEAFARVFSDLCPADRAVVQAACIEAETRLLGAGRAELLPGVEETLDGLRAAGIPTGIASNCSQGYLDAMVQGLGLGRWIDEARCLHTPGIADKAGMIEDLLLTFGTRSAVMVGDRLADRDAAWANGLPHVHLSRGYAGPGEAVPCEAVIDGMDALLPRLKARARWLRGILARLDPPAGGSIGVTGGPACGKSLFARDLVRVEGRAVAVSLEVFRRDGAPTATDPPASFAVEALVEELLAPHAAGRTVLLERDGDRLEVPPGALLVLEGPFLLHPLIAERLDRVLHLDVSEELALRRVAGRDARLEGPGPLMDLRSEGLALQATFEASHPPDERADLVIDAENALGPAASFHPPRVARPPRHG